MASERSEISTLQMLDTGLNADCVEWCPFENLRNILLCGTYQLLEEPSSNEESIKNESQVRVGQLQMYCLQQQTLSDEAISLPFLTLPYCLDMPGILDIKWAQCLINSLPLFGLVNSAGECQLWKLSETDEDGARSGTPNEGFSHLTDAAKEKECLKSVPVCLKTEKIGNCLALSLDWAGQSESSPPKVVVSDSSGCVSVLDAGRDFMTTSHWHAHDYEAWICAFDKWNPEVLYSGSDDCKLKVWDLRAGTQPVKSNSGFNMGVCSIQSNPVRESLLGVGSYDENLRVFDTRNMRQPLSVTSLGGGVWRVKWEPLRANSILTASMHNGFHIVDCSLPDSEPLPILVHYKKHGSLGYGADWCRQPPETRNARKENDRTVSDIENTEMNTESYRVCTCSFYDHSLQFWLCTF